MLFTWKKHKYLRQILSDIYFMGKRRNFFFMFNQKQPKMKI